MKRSAQKGQAFMEFVVCLIPLVFVFAGLLLVAVLGRGNALCTISARSTADSKSASGQVIGGVSATNIIGWDYGSDGIPFTSDDTPVSGGGTYLCGDDFDTAKDSVLDYSRSDRLEDLVKGGYAPEMPGREIYASAANLNGVTVTVGDLLSKSEMAGFVRMFRLYIPDASTEVSDTVFMPVTKD